MLTAWTNGATERQERNPTQGGGRGSESSQLAGFEGPARPGANPLSAGTNPKLSHYYVPVFSEHTTHTYVLGSVAMAARLISPYPLVWSWRGPVSDAEGPCPIRSWPVDGAGRGWGPRSTAGAGFGILAARGVRGVRLQLNPTRITRLPSLLPRLDALDGRQGPGRRPGAGCPAARRWRRQHLARQVGNGEIGPPPPPQTGQRLVAERLRLQL